MNKIAVFLGSTNETETFDREGTIKVFQRNSESWEIVQEIPIVLGHTLGLNEMRKVITEAGNKIEDCRIIIGKKIDGISYHVFEGLHFSIWEYEGQPESFLEEVLMQEKEVEQEEERLKKEAEAKSYVEKISSEHFCVNLKAMQSSHRNWTSKQALIPLFQQREFKKLNIICSHIPPWIESEAKKYGLMMETESLCSGDYQITLLSY